MLQAKADTGGLCVVGCAGRSVGVEAQFTSATSKLVLCGVVVPALTCRHQRHMWPMFALMVVAVLCACPANRMLGSTLGALRLIGL
jgi:hypothetical protein